MPRPQPGLHTEFCARNLLAVEEITMDGYGFQAHVTRVAPIGLVPGRLRFGVGFAGTRTIGRLPGAGAAVLDYLLIRRGYVRRPRPPLRHRPAPTE